MITTLCDRCPVSLSWKFEVNQNWFCTKESTQPFLQDPVATCYSGIAATCGCQTGPLPKVPMINLCQSCFRKQANTWGRNGAEVYANNPAKTAYDGVYFNNRLDYYFEGGKLDMDKIFSTAVHEMSHYWSKDHKGLDGKITHHPNLNWDECMTEFLARQTFEGVRKGTYKTMYGIMSQFISKAVDTVPRRNFSYRVYNVNGFPPPFNSLPTNPRMIEQIEQALAKKFVTWYLKGDQRVDSQNIGEFFSVNNIGRFFFTHLNNTILRWGRQSW